MITNVQREVALHLLANASRKRRRASWEQSQAHVAVSGALPRGRSTPEDACRRGMSDLLDALFGRSTADELYRDAVNLERTPARR